MPNAAVPETADPPGNGNLAPLDKCTSRELAVTITGAPSPLNAIARIHSARNDWSPEIRSGLKVIAVSGAAVVNTGDSKTRKCVNGAASSPGGGLIARRLLR